MALSARGSDSDITLVAVRHEGTRNSPIRQFFDTVSTLWFIVPATFRVRVTASYEQTVITPSASDFADTSAVSSAVPAAKQGKTALTAKTSASINA